MATSHYLNQCWNIVNCTLRNKHRWNFNLNLDIFIQERAFGSVVCKMEAILSRRQVVEINIKAANEGKNLVTFMIPLCAAFHYANHVTVFGSSFGIFMLTKQFCVVNPATHLTSNWLKQGSRGQHVVHLGPTGPRWAPCWPHELCYLGTNSARTGGIHLS